MSKINLEYLFPTALYTVQLEEMDQIHESLLNYIYKLKGGLKGGSTEHEDNGINKLFDFETSLNPHQPENRRVRSSTSGGTTISLETDNEHVNSLCQKLFPIINTIGGGLGYDLKNYELNCSGIWTNINQKYSFNDSHTHNDSLLSVAYYIKVPKDGKGGNFVIKDPRTYSGFFPYPFLKEDVSSDLSLASQNPQSISCLNGKYNFKEIEPQVGKMLIFPSWLKHKVSQNLSEEEDADRIVISFNIKMVEKTTEKTTEEW